ncbi:MAG TPA: hypothetical protein VLN49_25595 [Gemmatimonadaceae bacterium]|nr:hypothetical protein [Gemmatimonadaceae bacterium]
MRPALMMLPLLVLGCAKSETPKSDSSAMTAAPAATLAEADVAGTWTGTAKIAGTDSVIAHWTQVCAAGTCRETSQEIPKDTIPSTYTIMGDSAVGQTQPHAIPGLPAPIVEHWAIHVTDGKVTGTGRYVLASKPDSVVARFTFEGAKQP